MKINPILAACAVTICSTSLDLQAVVWFGNTTYGDGINWEDDGNWANGPGGLAPTSGQAALVNSNRTATYGNTGGSDTLGNIDIQNADGTATVNFVGSTMNSTGRLNIGHNDTTSDTLGKGVLNLSGGTLTTTGNVTVGNANYAHGELNASGGTLNFNNMTVGNGANNAGTVNIIEANSTITGSGNLTFGANALLSFSLASTGVSTIDMDGSLTVNAGADLVIDGALYTDGAKDITLINFGSLTSSTWNTVSYNNFDRSYSTEVLFDSVNDNMYLSISVVPEPSSTALLGLGGIAIILRRRK